MSRPTRSPAIMSACNTRDSGLQIKLDDGKINDCGHDEMR